jgi:putative membrane protein
MAVSARWRAALLAAASPLAAQAHPVAAAPARWDLPWTFEPWVVACLLLSLALYAAGLLRLWRRAGTGRGIRRYQVLAFALGWLALAVALVSPLDALGSRLFSAHMVQHELLMVVAAPLLCVAQPLVAWLWALPPRWRRAVGTATGNPAWRTAWALLTAPAAAWALHALVLWGWHVPALFDAALRSDAVHTAQHLGFVASALLYWWSTLRRDRAAEGAALLSLFTTMVHTAALGALLTLSPLPWYAPYQASAAALGWTALEDQQLGGLVMWVPAGMAYLAVAVLLAARWLREGAPGEVMERPLPQPATPSHRP